MKLAIVHDWLAVRGGAEQVLEKIHELYPEAPIYTIIYNPEKMPQFKNAKIITSYLNKFPKAQTHHQVLIPLMPKAIESFDLRKYDVVLSQSSACAKGAIKGKNATHICYCNTPLRYVWYPEIDPRASGSWLRRSASKYLKKWDIATINRVDKYYANSNYTKQRIKECWHRDAETLYPPVETGKWHISKDVGDYYIYVCRLVAYKKPDLVVEAFNKLGLKLKIVGSGPELDKLKKMAKPNIEFCGRVSDQELKNLYSKALAFIYPAIEDFGIVPVESMASGRPVIALGLGGSAETVIPGKTGLLFQEQTADSLITAVKDFKPEDYNPDEIRAWAKKFDTSVFKDKMKKAVETAYSSLGKD